MHRRDPQGKNTLFAYKVCGGQLFVCARCPSGPSTGLSKHHLVVQLWFYICRGFRRYPKFPGLGRGSGWVMSDALASWTSDIVMLLSFLQYVHTWGPCLSKNNFNQTSLAAIWAVEGRGTGRIGVVVRVGGGPNGVRGPAYNYFIRCKVCFNSFQ